MQQLIIIQPAAIGKDAIPTCNARDLHEFLESKAQFADWIKDRIEQYGFEEGKDYVTIASENSEAKRGGHNRKDYHLSLDMAKELSMVERTEKGKQARQYFIECERQAKEGKPLKVLPPAKQAIESIKAFNALFDWQQKRLHLDDNAANIRANQAVRKLCGMDLLALTDNTHLVAEDQDGHYYIPTDLGKQVGLSAQKVNQRLEAAGLQTKQGGHWRATTKGQPHSRLFDVMRSHNDGAPEPQTRWALSVLPLIQDMREVA